MRGEERRKAFELLGCDETVRPAPDHPEPPPTVPIRNLFFFSLIRFGRTNCARRPTTLDRPERSRGYRKPDAYHEIV